MKTKIKIVAMDEIHCMGAALARCRGPFNVWNTMPIEDVDVLFPRCWPFTIGETAIVTVSKRKLVDSERINVLVAPLKNCRGYAGRSDGAVASIPCSRYSRGIFEGAPKRGSTYYIKCKVLKGKK